MFGTLVTIRLLLCSVGEYINYIAGQLIGDTERFVRVGMGWMSLLLIDIHITN